MARRSKHTVSNDTTHNQFRLSISYEPNQRPETLYDILKAAQDAVDDKMFNDTELAAISKESILSACRKKSAR